MFLNRYLNLNETVDLSVKWIYIAFLVNILVRVAQIICNHIIFKRNIQSRFIIFFLYILLFLTDEICFIFAVKTSPRQFHSFKFSILAPLVLLITSIICTILYAIKALRAINLIKVIVEFIPGMITLVLIKIAFGLTYGSSICVIFVIEDLALTIFKALLLPDKHKIMKKKLD